MDEVLPGVLHWTTFHEGIGQPVHSHFFVEGAALFDPRVPEAGIEEIAATGAPTRSCCPTATTCATPSASPRPSAARSAPSAPGCTSSPRRPRGPGRSTSATASRPASARSRSARSRPRTPPSTSTPARASLLFADARDPRRRRRAGLRPRRADGRRPGGRAPRADRGAARGCSTRTSTRCSSPTARRWPRAARSGCGRSSRPRTAPEAPRASDVRPRNGASDALAVDRPAARGRSPWRAHVMDDPRRRTASLATIAVTSALLPGRRRPPAARHAPAGRHGPSPARRWRSRSRRCPPTRSRTTPPSCAERQVSLLGAHVRFQYGTTTAYGKASADASTSLIGLAEEIRIKVDDLRARHDLPLPRRGARRRPAGPSVEYGPDQSFTTLADDDGSDARPPHPPRRRDPARPGSPRASRSPTASSRRATDRPARPRRPRPGHRPATPALRRRAADRPRPPRRPTGADGAGPGADLRRPRARSRASRSAPTVVKGTVSVVLPDGHAGADRRDRVPTGTIIDATRRHGRAHGRARRPRGDRQTGQFWGGVFEVRQSAPGGHDQLVLRGGDFSGCPADSSRIDLASARPPTRRSGAPRTPAPRHCPPRAQARAQAARRAPCGAATTTAASRPAGAAASPPSAAPAGRPRTVRGHGDPGRRRRRRRARPAPRPRPPRHARARPLRPRRPGRRRERPARPPPPGAGAGASTRAPSSSPACWRSAAAWSCGPPTSAGSLEDTTVALRFRLRPADPPKDLAVVAIDDATFSDYAASTPGRSRARGTPTCSTSCAASARARSSTTSSSPRRRRPPRTARSSTPSSASRARSWPPPRPTSTARSTSSAARTTSAPRTPSPAWRSSRPRPAA